LSPKIPAAFSSNCVFQAVTCVACTSWCAAISATVFYLRIASSATRALNAAEWLRLGFLMDFVPPVTLSPGPKSTYTRVRKAGATSLVDAAS
jgi:hypothetical protein